MVALPFWQEKKTLSSSAKNSASADEKEVVLEMHYVNVGCRAVVSCTHWTV